MKELHLTNCEIAYITPEITKFSALNTLNLSNNKIKDIPDYLSSMIELSNLDLSANEIRVIPPCILSANLKQLNIIDNPLESLPENITSNGMVKTNFVAPMST